MTLRLNGSTSGYVEIDAPAVAGSTSITIPATTGGEFIVSDSAGDVNIDNGTLFVDASTNRVGIGTTSGTAKLEVVDSSFHQLYARGSSTVAGIRFGNTSYTNGYIYYDEGPNLIFHVNGSERVRIDSNGTFWHVASTGYNYYLAKSGAGNTYVAHYISSAEGSGYTYNIFYRDNTNTGSISYNGTGITFNNTSDYRLKENIVPIGNAINRLQQLKPSRFNFIAETGFDCDCTIDGFIAHEVKEVVPEAVTGEKDAVNDDGSVKPQQLDQSKLVPLLTAALQEAVAKIETLETANASQAATIAALDARLTALEGGTN